MTREDVRRAADGVLVNSYDDEVAHSLEDAMYRSVLRAIAAGADDPVGLAEESLRSASLQFARRCG